MKPWKNLVMMFGLQKYSSSSLKPPPDFCKYCADTLTFSRFIFYNIYWQVVRENIILIEESR